MQHAGRRRHRGHELLEALWAGGVVPLCTRPRDPVVAPELVVGHVGDEVAKVEPCADAVAHPRLPLCRGPPDVAAQQRGRHEQQHHQHDREAVHGRRARGPGRLHRWQAKVAALEAAKLTLLVADAFGVDAARSLASCHHGQGKGKAQPSQPDGRGGGKAKGARNKTSRSRSSRPNLQKITTRLGRPTVTITVRRHRRGHDQGLLVTVTVARQARGNRL